MESTSPWWRQAQTISDVQVTPEEMRALTPEGLAARLDGMGFTLVEQALPDLAGGEGTFLRGVWMAEEYDRYLTALHARGMRLVTYTNVHWVLSEEAEQHPDWLQVDEHGVPPVLGYGKGHAPCPNSPWGRWAAQQLREQARRYPLDGIFLDGPTLFPRTCYCPACRLLFRTQWGRDLPPWAERAHPDWPRFAAFREQTLARFLAELRQALHAERPGAVFFMNNASLLANWSGGRSTRVLAPHLDLLGNERGNLFNNTPPLLVPLWLTSAGALMLDRQAERPDGSRLPTVVYCCFRHLPWDYYGLTPVEMELLIAGAIAAGANPQIMGGLRFIDPPLEATISDLLHFYRRHADCFAGSRSAARVAVVWPQATTDWGGVHRELGEADGFAWDRVCWEEFAGCYEALVRAQVAVDVIDDGALADLPAGRYDSLVLPMAACLSAASADGLREFVRRGGRLLATGAPGIADELGRLRAVGSLDDVLGVRVTAGVVGPRTIDYIAPELSHPHWTGVQRPLLPSPVWAFHAQPAGGVPTSRYAEKLPSRYFPLHVEADAPSATFSHRFGAGEVTYVAGLAGALAWSQRFPEWLDFLARAALPAASAADASDGHQGKGEAATDIRLDGAPRGVQMLVRRAVNADLIVHLLNRSGALERPIRAVLPVEGARLLIPGGVGAAAPVACTLRGEAAIPVTRDGDRYTLQLPDFGAYEVVRVSWPITTSNEG
jgi:hypothetical protein